jgi:membrane protein YdbS with pleckstrin-like domain
MSEAGPPGRPERPGGERPGGDRPAGATPDPGTGPLPDPTHTLGSEARAYWTFSGLLTAIPLVVGGLVVSDALGDADGAPGWLRPALLALAVAAAAIVVLVVPQVRWRRWRYAVRDEELDLRHGTFAVVRTIVPVVRIQHVDTQRTVLSQMFGLAALTVHTAAGATSIPALPEREAAAIRDRIARLARVRDDL